MTGRHFDFPALLASILDVAADAIIVIDQNQTILYFEPAGRTRVWLQHLGSDRPAS